MAVYRKQPTFFNVPSKPQRQSQSFVPFDGLEINDNPLLNKQSSASDMLNMVVDDNYFLTLRPRLESDTQYNLFVKKLKDSLDYDYPNIWHIKDVIKVKDKYVAIVSIIESGEENVMFCQLDESDLVSQTHIYTTNTPTVGLVTQYYSFDSFIINVENEDVRFTHKISTNAFVLSDNEPKEVYIPTYKANVISQETLNTAPIYEDLNVLSDKYKVGFQFSAGQEDTFRILNSVAVNVEGDPFILDTLADFNQVNTSLVLNVKMKNYTATLTRNTAGDTYIEGVPYYAWTSGASTYVTTTPYIIPGSSLYAYPTMTDLTSGNRIGDVAIVQYPSINKTDIVSISGNEIIYVDGGKASAILNACPTRIQGDGKWWSRKYTADATLYSTYYYAWEDAFGNLTYTSSSVNPVDIHLDMPIYVNNGSSMVTTYSISNIEWPFEMSVAFYNVNMVTKLNYQMFKIYVGVDGPLGEYMSRTEFTRLYSPVIQYDNNGKRLGKFIYDSSSKALVRVYTGVTQLIRTAKNGGAPLLSQFTSSQAAIRQVTVYTYPIGDIEVHNKVLKINDSISMTSPTTAYDRWRVHYFDGQIIIVFDGTFKGVSNNGLSIMRTGTDVSKPDYNTFYDVITGAGTSGAGATTSITPIYVRNNTSTAGLFEIVSHIVWDGTNVYTFSPYIFPTFFNLVSTQPFIDPSDTIDSSKARVYINSSTSTSINLSAASGKNLATNRRNGSTMVGSQLLLYSVDNTTGLIKPDIIIVDITALASTRGYTLPSIYGSTSYNIKDLAVDVSGNVGAILKNVSNQHAFAKYTINFDYNNVIEDYFIYNPFGYMTQLETYPYRDTFVVVTDTGGISVITQSDNPILFTYAINNNDINPLKLTKEAIDSYNEARAAYLNSTHPLINSAYVGDSRIYYKDNYVFITNGSNYEYLPVIYSHRPQRKVRHISPYLREIGAVFEQNMIEFVTMVGNPFIDTSFINHALLPMFEKYEQLAIDYTDSTHLVTFFDNTVYLNSGGLYSLTFEPNTSQDNVRKATLVSKVINPKLTKEDMSKAILANSDPYVLIMFPDATNHKTKVYAYRADYTHWYYWELPIVVINTQDDNLHLRLQYEEDGVRHLAYFTDLPIKIDIDESLSSHTGSVERYLDFDKTVIPWYWKSQLLGLGSITKQKQLIETYFTFVNNNASIEIDTENNFDVVSRHITSQEFGLRYFTYNDIVTVSPKVEFQDRLNIINNIRQRTYLSRFNYCQLLCYNIDKESQILDKVRLANIVMVYKYLTGGK